jgi:hypothetical protein
VRWLKPKVLLEFGSGASSHFIQMAARRNAGEGRSLEHRIFDPYPFTASPLGPVDGAVVTGVRAEDVDPGRSSRTSIRAHGLSKNSACGPSST